VWGVQKKGSAVLMVLLFSAVFNILGLGLLELALAEFRISRNVALYDRLYYYAEAGIAEAVARLPRDGDLFARYTAAWQRLPEPPSFRVEVTNDGEAKLIRSTGLAEGKSRQLLVRAGINRFGEYALLAGGGARLGRVEVSGHVGADSITFVAGKSVVRGSLFAAAVTAQWDAGYRLAGGGRENPTFHGGNLELDFSWYQDRAFFFDHRWYIPGNREYYHWHDLGAEGQQLVYVPGNLAVSGDFVFDGVLVVRGAVAFAPLTVTGDFLVLAEGDIVLEEAFWQESGGAFFYSAGDIRDGRPEREPPLLLRGILAAAGDIELFVAAVLGDEPALKLYQRELEPGTFAGIATFSLEYLDQAARR